MSDKHALLATYVIVDRGQAILCGRCGLISCNAEDVRNRYCGNCRQFHTPLDEDSIDVLKHALIAIFVQMQPRAYVVLREFVVRGAALDEVMTAVVAGGASKTGLSYNAVRVTAEWLIACRSASMMEAP